MTKVVLGLTHAEDDAESVLICYLLGVEALRAGKQALMWLTKDGVKVATDGFAQTVTVSNAPSIADLHAEYVEKGGRFYACPVCVKTRGMEDAEVKGAPSLYEFTAGGHSFSTTDGPAPWLSARWRSAFTSAGRRLRNPRGNFSHGQAVQPLCNVIVKPLTHYGDLEGWQPRPCEGSCVFAGGSRRR